MLSRGQKRLKTRTRLQNVIWPEFRGFGVQVKREHHTVRDTASLTTLTRFLRAALPNVMAPGRGFRLMLDVGAGGTFSRDA